MAYFRENLSNALEALKSTFRLIKKHPVLIVPPTLLVLFYAALFFVLIYSFAIVGDQNPETYRQVGAVLAFLVLIFGITFVGLMNTFFAAVHAWMVSRAIKGQKPTLFDGFRRALFNIFDIILYSIMAFLIRILAGSMRVRVRGIMGAIISMILRPMAWLVEKSWEYASFIIIPDMIISERHIFQSFKEVPKILSRAPAYLIGGFGFDFIMARLWFVVFILSFALSAVTLLLFGNDTGFAVGGLSFLLLALLLSIAHITVKSTYFTVLYMELQGSKKTGFFSAIKEIKKSVSKPLSKWKSM